MTDLGGRFSDATVNFIGRFPHIHGFSTEQPEAGAAFLLAIRKEVGRPEREVFPIARVQNRQSQKPVVG